ncbi:hypothetical protein ACIGXM_34015 [Kitasatospora sp. NPDC052896]|uniref:hypothetical protein n=1 Tax=Kitasatospora sp. NPDC052896 TaxID=3364061 RepID=UPI0037C51323
MPQLTDGLELHGLYHGSGFVEPLYTARRGDGQVVHLSLLLYQTARAIDGIRDTERIAARVSATFGQEVSAENIAYLVEQKLRPLGVVAHPAHGTALAADVPGLDMLVDLRGRGTLLRPRAVRTIARLLARLHHPLVVTLVLAAALGMDFWFFAVHGAVPALLTVLNQPATLLAVLALVALSLVFHEFGHASACHYGGASPGRIGCGLYLLWPSLFTDVTDVYRLPRRGRLRTDLGGVYFNLVYMLALVGAYAATGRPFLLAAVYLGHFEVLEQLVPAARLDGYYILADLAGIPDLYGQIGPVLRGAIPGRREDPRAQALTGRARTVITTWVLAVFPLIAADLGYTLWNLPGIGATAWHSISAQAVALVRALDRGQATGAVASLTGLLMLVVPFAGTALMLVGLAKALARGAAGIRARRSVARRRPHRRPAATAPDRRRRKRDGAA